METRGGGGRNVAMLGNRGHRMLTYLIGEVTFFQDKLEVRSHFYSGKR
jgi:hypothetical protein